MGPTDDWRILTVPLDRIFQVWFTELNCYLFSCIAIWGEKREAIQGMVTLGSPFYQQEFCNCQSQVHENGVRHTEVESEKSTSVYRGRAKIYRGGGAWDSRLHP